MGRTIDPCKWIMRVAKRDSAFSLERARAKLKEVLTRHGVKRLARWKREPSWRRAITIRVPRWLVNDIVEGLELHHDRRLALLDSMLSAVNEARNVRVDTIEMIKEANKIRMLLARFNYRESRRKRRAK